MSDFRHSIESKLLDFFSLISLPFWKIADLLGTCWLSDTSHVAPIPTEQRGTSSIRAPRLRWRVPCAVPTQTLPSLPRNHPPWDLPGIVDHRWSPLIMVDHGWQVNQIINWVAPSDKEKWKNMNGVPGYNIITPVRYSSFVDCLGALQLLLQGCWSLPSAEENH